MIASSFFDPVLGVDVHFEMVPTPAPVPTPIPNPFTGIVFDPIGLAAGIAMGAAIGAIVGAPFQGPVLYWTAFPATNTGTEAKHVPGHILIPPGTMWAPFPKTPKPVIHPGETPSPPMPVMPENDAVMIVGSKTVHVMGSNAVRLGDIALSCSEPLRLPSSVVLAVPKGAPILIGGPPALDLMSAIMASLRTRFVSDSLHALVSRLKPSRFRNFLHRVVCFFTGHPVDVASGKVMTEFLDVELPGPLPLRIERIYSSAFAKRNGPMGHGWSLSVDQAVWRERGKVVLLVEDGREIEFDTFDLPGHAIAPGQRVDNPIEGLTLHCDSGGGWRVIDRHGVTRRFGPILDRDDGRAMIQELIAAGGHHRVTFFYDKGVLEWVRDCAGRLIGFRHDARGRMTELYLPKPDGEGYVCHRRYVYDDADDLVSVVDSLGHTWRFTYVTHLLTRESDRNGLSFYFGYDGLGEDAWCVRTWGDGGIHDHVLSYDKHKRVTFVTDSRGYTTQYHMNLVGQVVKVVRPMGGETIIDYDSATLRRTSTTDPSGATISLAYTPTGQLAEIDLPSTGGYQFEYTADNRPAVVRDATGATWTWRHNSIGQPVERCEPTGYRVAQVWEDGLIKQIEDSLGRRLALGHDKHLNLSGIIYSDGKQNQWLHDNLGRVVMATGEHGQTKRFWYDSEGNLLRSAEGDHVRAYEYDRECRLIRARGPTRDVQFGHSGLALARRVEAGQVTSVEYDSEGQVAAIHSPMGHVHRYVRDPDGDIVEEIAFDGQRTRYERDACGRIVKRTAPSGAETQYAYDPTGLVTRVVHAGGPNFEFEYDAEGRVTRAAIDDAAVELTRDVLGRVIRERSGEHSVQSSYGQLGRRVELSTSLGLTLAIDRDQRDRPTVLNVEGGEARFAWSWGARGQLGGLELPGEVVVRLQHDGFGRPTYQTLQSSQASHGLEYDWSPGHELTRTRSPTRTRWFGHDALGGLAWSRSDDGATEYRTMDAAGNVVCTPTAATQIHDAMGRVVQARHVDGRVIAYEYDADGQLICKCAGEEPAWQLRWNSDGTLAAVLRPDGREVSFAYDAFGRRTHKRFDGVVTRWVWDGDVPLHQWCESAESNASEVIDEQLITWLFEPESHVPLARLQGADCHSIITDYQGTPILMINASGEIIWAAESDLLGKLRLIDGQRSDCPFRLPGQWEDEETGLHYNRFRYYDPDCGSYISADPLGFQNGPSAYAYVRDPVHERDPYGLKFLFRGDDFYSAGPVGRPLGSDADITTPWDHVRRESNQTSIFTSFAEDRTSAAKFTDGDNIYKVDLDRIRQLEADGIIKTYTPDQVFEMMRNSGDKQLRKDAANVREIMRKNKEILVEGQIPEDDVKKCR